MLSGDRERAHVKRSAFNLRGHRVLEQPVTGEHSNQLSRLAILFVMRIKRRETVAVEAVYTFGETAVAIFKKRQVEHDLKTLDQRARSINLS
jgi:hypothetical protein